VNHTPLNVGLRGYSVLDSGISQMPRMLVMMVAAPIAGRLYTWVDSRLVSGTVHRQATRMAYNDVCWMMGMCFVFCRWPCARSSRKGPQVRWCSAAMASPLASA
jgi:hypothetical protein